MVSFHLCWQMKLPRSPCHVAAHHSRLVADEPSEEIMAQKPIQHNTALYWEVK